MSFLLSREGRLGARLLIIIDGKSQQPKSILCRKRSLGGKGREGKGRGRPVPHFGSHGRGSSIMRATQTYSICIHYEFTLQSYVTYYILPIMMIISLISMGPVHWGKKTVWKRWSGDLLYNTKPEGTKIDFLLGKS
jgi:hypothetical protein